MMLSTILFRSDDSDALATEFLRLTKEGKLSFTVEHFEKADFYVMDTAFAVHYAETGAQGDAGTIKALYPSRQRQGVRIQRGDYSAGTLDMDAVCRMLPMLEQFRYRSLYRFGENRTIPDDWQYQYMGALNHLFVRKELCDKASLFLQSLQKLGCRSWQLFDAIAWFCGA